MADPTEDAVRSVVDPSAAGIRCPLLVIFAADGGSAAGEAEPVPTVAEVGAAEVGAAEAEVPAAEVRLALPSTANRCGATQLAIAVSLSQQRLVCFDGAHIDCPRFVRATGSVRGGSGRPIRAAAVAPIAVASVPVVAAATGPVGGTGSNAPGAHDSTSPDKAADPIAPATPVTRSTRRSGARPATSRPRPIVVASAILVAALVVAFAFTTYRGGLAMPSAAVSAGAAGSPVTVPSAAAVSSVPSPVASATEVASLSASPSPSVSPSPLPSVSASPSPTATPVPTPSASLPPAFAGLKPCPDAPDCYLYRIHPGDNLIAIAKRFGITIVALKAANPEIKDPSLLHVGDKIRIPLPSA